MAERLSTGLVNGMLTGDCVKDLMAGGTIHIYSGTQPANADATETGTLLAKITVDGLTHTPGNATNGLNMGTATGGVLAKAAAETWEGTGLAAASTGTTAGWFRWYDVNVTTGASTSAVRMDGAIGTSSSYELQMSNTTIVENVPITVNTFNFTMPKS